MKTKNNLSAYQDTINSSIEQEILTASPSKLVYLLYCGLSKHFKLLISSIESKNNSSENHHSSKAIDIVIELRSSLIDSHYPEFVNNMEFLYDFLLNQILQTRIDKDINRLKSCLDIIDPIESAWEEILGDTK